MMRKDIRQGMSVRSSDGKDLGTVVGLGNEAFLIEKGFFFPKNYYVSYGLIGDLRDEEILLSESGEVLKEHLEFEGVENRPLGSWKLGEKAGEVEIHKSVVAEQKQVSIPVTKEGVTVERVPFSGTERRPAEGATFKESTVRVPLSEEEVEIRKRPVIREEVRVSNEAHEEERRMNVEARKEKAEIRTEGEVEKKGGYNE